VKPATAPSRAIWADDMCVTPGDDGEDKWQVRLT